MYCDMCKKLGDKFYHIKTSTLCIIPFYEQKLFKKTADTKLNYIPVNLRKNSGTFQAVILVIFSTKPRMKHEDFKTATRPISRSIDRSERFSDTGVWVKGWWLLADFLLVGRIELEFQQLRQLEEREFRCVIASSIMAPDYGNLVRILRNRER